MIVNFKTPNLLLFILLISGLFPVQAQSEEDKLPIMDILYSVVEQKGSKEAIKMYYEMRRSDRELYDFSFTQLNRLGLKLYYEDKVKDAIEIFNLNLKMYPEKVTSHNSLADALLKAGNKTVALKYYKLGLEKLNAIPEIDPEIFKSYEEYGNRQIDFINELNLTETPDMVYWGNVGGTRAKYWDTDQIIDFKKQRPELQVNYKTHDFYNLPVPEFVVSELDTANQPDVVSSFVKGHYREFIQDNKIRDLQDIWESEGLDEQFKPYIKSAVSYDGKPYFIPVSYQWNPIWYRKDVFDSLNLKVPTTWDELLEVCKVLKKNNYQPFTVSGNGWQPPLARWFTSISLRLHGADFHEELMNGQISWKDERVKNIFKHWSQLFEINALDTASAQNDWMDAVRDLASGKAVMWNIGEWLFEFNAMQSEIENIDFFPMPVITPGVPKAEILHLYGVHAIKKSEDNEAAIQFLKTMASAEIQQDNHKHLKYRIPANSNAQEELTVMQQKIVAYLETVEHFVPLLEFNAHPELAQHAMDEFLIFWKFPNEIDAVLESLEGKRKEIYGN